ncbi:sigma-70 family RNA polymerase sigma factor [Pueribacillus theae]|nr:sigma-70 family RNA polymerase sigma factor [Pueribacillus theae]
MTTKMKLVARAKKGDTEAFQVLINEDKEKLYRMAFVYMKDEEDALEVFQETVYAALKSISSLKNNRYFSTWLTRILINQAIDALRKKKKVVPMSHDVLENLSESETIKPEEQLDLLEALAEINGKYKTVLLLRYYEDYTIGQIAAILGCPEGTVKTNIRRGLESLKQKMKGVYLDDRKNSVFQRSN